MILTLKNIGKIKDAEVELNGITVIAGENNTGKSTVGKILFSVFNSLYKIEEQIHKERKNVIKRTIEDKLLMSTDMFIMGFETDAIVDKILKNIDNYKSDFELLERDIISFFSERNKDTKNRINGMEPDYIAKKVWEIISLSEESIFKTVLTQKFNSEFNGQINNIYFPDDIASIELNIRGTNIEISIEENEVKDISKRLSLNTEVIYIDDPFVLDDMSVSSMFFINHNNYIDHRSHLQSKLRNTEGEFGVGEAINKLMVSKKIDNIFSKINTICGGEMIKTAGSKYGYKANNSEKILDIKNISTGLKTFVILKTLLLNESIKDNGTIILDEPEIHLHPEWQIVFAEIIVLLQKEFNMHILLNTHSPYFLRAIQIYSAKYEIADKCNYYLAENIEEQAIIRDVTTSIDEVYAKLAKPFESLEIERYSDD